MVIIVSLTAEILQRLQNLNKETKRFLPEVHQTSAIQWSPELLQNINERHMQRNVSEPRMWGEKTMQAIIHSRSKHKLPHMLCRPHIYEPDYLIRGPTPLRMCLDDRKAI